MASFKDLPPVLDHQRPQGCANCFFGGLKVGSRGPEDSPFVIVGESPGSTELLKGYPFMGDSGEMLEQVLADVGLTADDPQPYIINAIECFPRQKDPDRLAQAVLCCQSRLHEQIRKHPRKVILTLGAAAAWSLTGNFNLKITQERGKVYPFEGSQHGLVATVHPAFLMRQGTMFPKWKKDVEYAVSLLHDNDTKAGKWYQPEYGVIETREQLAELVAAHHHAKYIAGDIETGGAKSAGLHFQKGYILELVICSDLSKGRWVDVIPGKVIWENMDLMKELLGNTAEWIWQNGKFDIKFFRYEGIIEARVDHDTMLASYALNENKGHDLDTIAWDVIGAPQHKKVVDDWFARNRIAKKNRDYSKLPTDLRQRYAAIDVSKTYAMFFPLYEMVCADPHTNKLYHKILIPASEFLTKVEMRGLTPDENRFRENDAYILEQLQPIEAEIQKFAIHHMGHQINIASPTQLSDLLFKYMKLGNIGGSTSEDALIAVQRKHDHPIIPLIMRWRTLSKARNTYVKYYWGDEKTGRQPWIGLDGKVHVTFKLHGTSTGRLSSSDPTNLQNWPRDPRIRGAFVAAHNHILAECDLNQAELRCLAIMSGDPTLLDIYTKNEVSIHHITSVAMFGEGYTDDQKMRAKAVNFGIVYGRTAPSLAEEFNISLREAEEYIRIWFERYPVARDFINESRNAPNLMRNLVTNFGRKKRWGVVSHENRRNSENESANFPHQSSAHDVTLLSGIECQPVIYDIWFAHFLNEIHDALYPEIFNDPDIYGPCIAYVQSVMQRVPKDWGLTRVPFLAEAKIGRRWGAKRNAKEMGETNSDRLAEYMSGFEPTDDHKEEAQRLVADYYQRRGQRVRLELVAG